MGILRPMPIALPPTLRPMLQPVFDALPFDAAMTDLVLEPDAEPTAAQAAARDAVADAAGADALHGRPDLLAGLWLYADDLDRAHTLAQGDNTPTGSFWHAVVHRREGDFDNARYWYRKAGQHPAMNNIDLTGGGAGSGTDVAKYRPSELVDRVERGEAEHRGQQPALVSQQRKEWKALFEWCAAHSES